MELVIIGILGYLISTISDFKIIKELKKENSDLRFENKELKLVVEKLGDK